VALEIIRTGWWERDVCILSEAAAQNNTTVFDVGANIGSSALPLLAKHAGLRVVSFEPSPSVLPYLKRTHDESPYQNRWEIVTKAVTESPNGEITFTRFSGAGDVYEGIRDTGRGGHGTQIRIPSTNLDTAWIERNRPKVSLIKIDVEGAELGVLMGVQDCIRQCRPVIIAEWYAGNFSAYGQTASAMLEMAERIGYEVYTVPEVTRVTNPGMFELHLANHHDLILYPKL
jgi:FkbM family methyltransferase